MTGGISEDDTDYFTTVIPLDLGSQDLPLSNRSKRIITRPIRRFMFSSFGSRIQTAPI